MNWMHVLYWVIGIIGYILMGGVVVWTARMMGFEKEFSKGPWILQTLFFPCPIMAIIWPISVLCFVVLMVVILVFAFLAFVMNGFDSN